MKEFKTRTNGGKVKVRGLFKISLFAYNVGIAINFGRIFRYLSKINISPDGLDGNNSIIISLLKIYTQLIFDIINILFSRVKLRNSVSFQCIRTC